jgi:hypothetical protein
LRAEIKNFDEAPFARKSAPFERRKAGSSFDERSFTGLAKIVAMLANMHSAIRERRMLYA